MSGLLLWLATNVRRHSGLKAGPVLVFGVRRETGKE